MVLKLNDRSFEKKIILIKMNSNQIELFRKESYRKRISFNQR